MHFLERNFFYLEANFTQVCFWGVQLYVIIGLNIIAWLPNDYPMQFADWINQAENICLLWLPKQVFSSN